jgi:hypothetical protein
MEVLLGLPPVDVLIKSEARMYNYRFSISNKPEIVSLCDTFLLSTMNKEEIYKVQNADHMNTKYFFERDFRVEFPERKSWLSNKVLSDITDVTWFTDGSKTDQGTGYGIYRLETEESGYGSVEHTATVFQSEIEAIIECVKVMLETGLRNRDIIIASDSKASLRIKFGNVCST